jgi:hypothetical protein
MISLLIWKSSEGTVPTVTAPSRRLGVFDLALPVTLIAIAGVYLPVPR